ncbi:hypothetical protein AB0A73_21475 [Glycomyces sp. NPDC047369]
MLPGTAASTAHNQITGDLPMPDAAATVHLGDGLLEVEYPKALLEPADYVWDDVVCLNPSEKYDLPSLAFDADLAGRAGTLLAVLVHPPRQVGVVDKLARGGAAAPAFESEVVIGTGVVRLRERETAGEPIGIERTAIGLDTPLDGDAVRSLLGLWVRLELRS